MLPFKTKIFFIYSLIFLLHSTVHAFQKTEHVDGLGDPSCYVAGCVNVISGAFVYSNPDLIIDCPEELSFIRHYNSYNMLEDSFITGFTHNHSTGKIGFSYDNKTRIKTVHIDERGGNCLKYSGYIAYGKMNTFYLDGSHLDSGLTNTYAGEISGRTNLRNSYVVASDKPSIMKGMVLGDGTKKEYNTKNQLVKEIRPSGNIIIYSYNNDKNDLSSVRAYNSDLTKILGWMYLKYDSKGNLSSIKASDGKSIAYQCEDKTICKVQKRKLPFLVKSKSFNQPMLSYDYHHETMKFYPEGADSYLKIELHKLSSINAQGKSRLKCLYDDEGRVQTLYLPGGKGLDKVYMFSYNTTAGISQVRNPLGAVEEYFHGSGRILSKTIYEKTSSSKKNPYKMELYSWGKLTSLLDMRGCLKLKAIANGKAQCQAAIEYTYDGNRNVTKKTLFGNLSGLAIEPVLLPKFNQTEVSAEEQYSEYYTYSKDGRNLLLSHQTEEGVEEVYEYIPETNRVSAKLIKLNGRIIKREFFEYNSFMTLTKKSEDDGSSPERNVFDDVTCSRVVVHTINEEPKTIGFGKPLETLEGYIDPKTGSIVQQIRKTFLYGQYHQLLEEAVFDSNDQFQYVLSYEYDDLGRCVREIDREGIATNYQYNIRNLCVFSQKEGAGFETYFKYDYADRLIEKKEVHDSGEEFVYSYAYDKMGNLVEEKDAYGHIKKMTYDSLGRLIETIYPLVQLADGTIENPVEKKEYDIFDHVIKEVDPEGNVTCKKYTIRGQVSEIVFPDDSKETYIYNLNGTLSQKYEKNGSYHVMQYDELLRLIKEETFSGEGVLLKTKEYGYQSDLLVYEIDSGLLIEYQYDLAGRKISKAIHGQDKVILETYAYDSMGRLHETKKWLSVDEGIYISHIQSFDVLDRVVEEKTVDSEGILVSKNEYAYDANGNCIEETVWQSEDKASITSTEYTSYGLPLSIKDPMGNTTVYAYDFLHENALGQNVLLTTVTDAKGRVAFTIKDALGREEAIWKEHCEGKLLAFEKIFYDLNGNKTVSHTDVIFDGIKQRTYSVLWEYDSMNRVVHLWEDPQGKSKKTAYTYHLMGMLSSKQNPDGVVVHHEYDSLGREQEVCATDKSIHYTFKYNERDQLIESCDLLKNSTLHRDYDCFGNLVWEKLPTGKIFAFGYDSLNRLTDVFLPDGSRIKYTYNSSGMKEAKRYSVTGDFLYCHKYDELDHQGRSLKSQLITRDFVCFDWDLNGRLKSIDSPFFSEEVPVDGYDQVGNLLKAKFSNGDHQYQNKYAYDGLNQLISESTFFEKTYSYDSIHNRLKEGEIEYQINSLNQIEKTDSSDYVYDLNGNLTYQQHENFAIHYHYDGLNRLVDLEKEKLWKIEYVYDSYGRRIISKHYIWDLGWVLQDEFDYLYQGIYEIGCCDKEGRIKQLRVMGKREGPALRACIAFEFDGKIFAPLYDHIFNVVALIDFESNIQSGAIRYSAFGMREDLLGDSNQVPWLLSNQRYDALGDLYHFGVRDYRPEIGRWISPDPADFLDGMNLYAYTRNCPTVHLDFYGYFTQNPERRPIARPVYGGLICGELAEPVSKGAGKYVETMAHHALPYSPQRFFLEGCGRMAQGDSFVPEEGFMVQSVSGSTDGHELSGVRVRYVPGILTTKGAAEKQAQNISDHLRGAKVHWTCQQSRGFVQDLIQCVAEMMHIETPAIQHLSKQIMSDYHEMEAVYGDNFKLAIIAHSRGGLDLHEGTQKFPEAIKDRMSVLALGSAKLMNSTDYEYLKHYSNIYDLVTHIAVISNSNIDESNFQYTNYSSGNPLSFILDHYIDSPGYQEILEQECQNLMLGL